jgi:hypothetical protein
MRRVYGRQCPLCHVCHIVLTVSLNATYNHLSLRFTKGKSVTRLLLGALAVVASVGAQAQSVSVSGTWTVSATVSGNQSEQSCSFTQTDTDLTGTCKGERGAFAIKGKIDGKSVTWQFDMEYEGQRLTPVYSGTLESAEKIVGTVDVQGMGVSGEFTATRGK